MNDSSNPTSTNNTNPVTRLYPNASYIGVKEIYVDGEGWIRPSGMNVLRLTNDYIKRLNKNYPDLTTINLYIKDEFGQERFPDYKLTELLNNIN